MGRELRVARAVPVRGRDNKNEQVLQVAERQMAKQR